MTDDAIPLEGILENALDGVVRANADGIIQGWNREATSIFGWSHEEAIGLPLTTIIPKRYRAAHQKGVERFIATGRAQLLSRRIEIEALHREGHEFPVELTVTPYRSGDQTGFVAFIRDLSESKKAAQALSELTRTLELANERLEVLAAQDYLTKLLNRRGIALALAQEQARCRREGTRLVSLFVDLDDFKKVNDALGHVAGDVVLREVAARVKKCLRTNDHAARIGGDEFLILLPGTRGAEARAVADRVRLVISQPPIVVNAKPLRVTASSGVMEVEEKISGLEELLSRAERLLKRSKRAGKNLVSTPDGIVSDHEVAEDVLLNGKLTAACHPIIQLSSNKITGYEMLIRGPNGPFETPGALFSSWQEQNLTLVADVECLRICTVAAKRLPQDCRIHLNILPSTLLSTPTDRLLELIRSIPSPREICLELSEQQIIGEPSYLVDKTASLKAAGVLVAIDDVGFGRSPIEALIALEPDIAKIDRALVTNVGSDPTRRGVFKRLLQVLDALGIQAVAEGVESENDIEFLKEAGVEYAQGFFWGHPERIQASSIDRV